MAARTLLTIDDFEKLPIELAKHKELVDGELIDVSGNTPIHILSRDRLFIGIFEAVERGGLGVVLTELEYNFGGDAHGPDISFFGPAKKALLEMNRRVQPFVPDLAIEVASQNDSFSALLRKKDRYRRCGTAEVWIVSIESREVYVYSEARNAILGESDELATPLLPGFRATLSEILRGL